MGSFKDITGQRYGRWFVVKRVQAINKKTMWLCRCDCWSNVKQVDNILETFSKMFTYLGWSRRG